MIYTNSLAEYYSIRKSHFLYGKIMWAEYFLEV